MLSQGFAPGFSDLLLAEVSDLLDPRPVWRVEETGVEKALEKIRANWKEIRAEGRELMGVARMWKEDPGFNSIPGARGWWVGSPDEMKFL